MTSRLDLAARLSLDSQRWTQGLTQAQGKTRGFVGAVRGEFAHLRSFLSSTTGQLASLGVGFTAMGQLIQSARIDQSLTRIKQTAGLTAAQTEQLRGSLHEMARQTGNSFDDLQAGFGQLVAGGLTFEQALPTIQAINQSMRVTGSDATTLATALQSAQASFEFDLSKAGVAAELLDKMTVAGRAGVIEIEDLAGVFGSAANEAKAAGLSFEQTLAVIEGMGTATTKDRVGTLVASTLRVFTNARYMRDAQKATGVRFFDRDGERRNALDIFQDLKGQYDKLTTDKARFKFISQAFGQTDLDTIKGIRQSLDGGNLQSILKIVTGVQDAVGTTKRDLGESMQNAVAQAGVLKETLASAADAFARPITAAFANTVQYATKSEKDGGLAMSGGELLGAGAAGAGVLYVLSRVLGGRLGAAVGAPASLAGGVVAGEVAKKMGADLSVFIAGAAPGVFGGMPGTGPGVPPITPAAALKTTAGVGAAATAGWVVGKSIYAASNQFEAGRQYNEDAGRAWAQIAAFFGSQTARDALAQEQKALKLDINVRSEGGASATVRPDFSNVRGSVRSSIRTGRMLDRPGRE